MKEGKAEKGRVALCQPRIERKMKAALGCRKKRMEEGELKIGFEQRLRWLCARLENRVLKADLGGLYSG